MINAVSPAATQQALTSNTAGSHQQHSELSPATQWALTSCCTVSSRTHVKGLHKEDLFYTSRLHHCFLFEQEKCLIRSMGHNADHDPITQCWNQHHVVGNVWKGLPFSCDRCFKCTLYSLSWVFFSLNTSNSEPNQNTLPNLIKIHYPIWSKYTTQSNQNALPDLLKIHYPICSKYTTRSAQNTCTLPNLIKIHYPI